MEFACTYKRVRQRMFGQPVLRVIAVVAVCGIAAAGGVARAADITPALTEANKMLQNGAYVRAIELITSAMSSNNIPAELAARGLLMRAQANEKLGKAAFALADYNQALWMQALPDKDRKVAEEGRGRVQSGLGVKEASDDSEDAAPQQKTRPASGRAVQEESSGGGFFSSLFGSSQTAKKEEPPQHAVVAVVQPEPEAPKPAAVKPARAAAAPKTAGPAVQPAVQTTRVATNTKPQTTAAMPPSEQNGEFLIQFAALMDENNAIAEVNRIAKKFGADLGGRSPSVVIVPTKDGGTLYKIVAGPYPKAEGLATCELLKTKNLSCMIISRR